MKYLKKVILVIVVGTVIVYLLAYFNVGPLAIYRTRKFIPMSKIESFENWNIYPDVTAYEKSWGVNPNTDHNFNICIEVSTYVRKPKNQGFYRKSHHKPKIKSLRVFYGDEDHKEVVIKEYRRGTQPHGLTTYLTNKEGTYIPFEIKKLFIISEVEFVDNQGRSTIKKYKIPLERKESSFIFLKLL